jgi:glycosyltransferase involved in cell wall biosynthesis
VRVTAIVPLYPPRSLVGAWLSTHECLAHLVRHGHQVQVFTSLDRDAPYEHDGVHVAPLLAGAQLDTAIATCDVVLSHCGDAHKAAKLAARWGKPNVRMAHGRITDPAALDGAALVVFNSHSLAESVDCPVPSVVVHPPVDPARYRTAPGELVTLVNLCWAKGGELFWRLARSMPDVGFLGVLGGYGHQIVDRWPNVEVIPATEDMRTVYGRTRVLLMPSEAETWGRTGVEAFASGIPVIAHPTPGLVESLGPAGIFVDRDDADGWVTGIRRLLDNPAAWSTASTAALARSAQLRPAEDLDRFRTALEDIALTHRSTTRCA